MITSLQATIDDCKKKIAMAQATIKLLTGNESSQQNDFSKFRAIKKTREGSSDWFSKIKHVLEISGKPLTSREILDMIYEEFPDFEKDSTHMGSLSSALRSKSKTNEIIREKTDGEFARFSLMDDLL